MNLAVTVPYLGFQVDDRIFYIALIAIFATILIRVIWGSLSKGAVAAIAVIAAVIAVIMMGR